MRLEDIAKLSDVSVSTVSKIINGKDQSITPSTRERVLKIVKECNYSPGPQAQRKESAKTFKLGFIGNHINRSALFLDGFLSAVQGANYSLFMADSNGDPSLEEKNVLRMASNRVDAVLWQPIDPNELGLLEHFKKTNIPVYLLNDFGNLTEKADKIDFSVLVRTAVDCLLENGHKSIGFMAKTGFTVLPLTPRLFRLLSSAVISRK